MNDCIASYIGAEIRYNSRAENESQIYWPFNRIPPYSLRSGWGVDSCLGWLSFGGREEACGLKRCEECTMLRELPAWGSISCCKSDRREG